MTEEQVEFEVKPGDKGLQATLVTGPNGSPVQGASYIPTTSQMPYPYTGTYM
jgi:hypothetical protein